jgi:predicted DNA-binding protein
MQTYATEMRNARLVQTVVKPVVLRQLDKLAKATGHTRAGYLRHLIELHVQALDPRLAKALAPGPERAVAMKSR